MSDEYDKYLKQTSQEICALVDENNVELCGVSRSQLRLNNLHHRASYIYIYNAQHQLIVQKRTNFKDYCPGFFDPSTGGVVQYKENATDNARRELQEELGINADKLVYHFTDFYEDNHTRVFGYIFTLAYNECIENLRLQPEEVESLHLMSLQQVLRVSSSPSSHNHLENFTPDSIAFLRKLISLPQSPLTLSQTQ